jgi:Na+-transporting methylmalonyl-CoA/oxaloacetate decarboxylase gamma subunit
MSDIINFLELIIVGMTVVVLFLLYIIFVVYKPRGSYGEYVRKEIAKEIAEELKKEKVG